MIEIDYKAQLLAAVRAVRIVSLNRYSWFGADTIVLPGRVRRAVSPDLARRYLGSSLQHRLYNDFYCKGNPMRGSAGTYGPLQQNAIPFLQQLERANRGVGGWETGWRVVARGNPAVVLEDGRLALWPRPDEMWLVNQEAELGHEGALRYPKGLPSISPGFYLVLGDTPPPANGSGPLVRLYWNVSAQGAAVLVGLVTEALNRLQAPFRLKVVSNPEQFDRCDTAILYIEVSRYATVAATLVGIYAQVRDTLRGDVPALTGKLAPGLGLAEDPGGGESYGLHMCGLLAEGLLRAFELGLSGDARLGSVLALLQERGISPERPYLRPGSQDIYNFDVHHSSGAGKGTLVWIENATDSDRADYLETAAFIGWQLCRTAIWYNRRCTWIGATAPGTVPGDRYGQALATLGPDLYAGTAGVGLFLACLAEVTGDPTVERTALGAMEQAFATADRIAPADRQGLYTGWIGIALAGCYLDRCMGQGWSSRAANLLDTLLEAGDAPGGFDYLGGSAGAIMGLLALKRLLGCGYLYDRARSMGDQLALAGATGEYAPEAHRTNAGRKWGRRPLTGLAHGAAGVGAALMELYATSQEVRYRHASEAAFAYERAYFDILEANWPDFRAGIRRPYAYSTHWCHGAPGIALTRRRAYSLTGDVKYLEETQAGIQTTEQWLESALRADRENFSLCHGLGGNAWIAFEAATPGGVGRYYAHAVARRGIEAHKRYGVWLCGTPGGEAQGLMLGLSGIGLFYLRLAGVSSFSPLYII
ncbi:MAG: lanthionine synthetase LanC family protein [Chloroflexia bacterium]